mgnify:CR=1 FL=1
MERQVSNQDNSPWIDQSQAPIEPTHGDRTGSVNKSERKSQISNSSVKKISNNLKQLTLILETVQPQRNSSMSR